MSAHDSLTAKSVPRSAMRLGETSGNSSRKRLNGHVLLVLACCAVMGGATGVLVAGAPAGQSPAQTLLLAAPMLACVIMHVVMHRFMGKPCHAHSGKDRKND